MSSHPEPQSYMADVVAREWADRAMTFQGLRAAVGANAMGPQAAQEFIEDVREKLSHNHQPQIVFTEEGGAFRTHAVLVSGIREENGKTVLCIRDNNYNPLSNENCSNKMSYGTNPQGFTYTGYGWNRLGRVTVAHNNDSDVVAQHRALTEHCNEVKDCP